MHHRVPSGADGVVAATNHVAIRADDRRTYWRVTCLEPDPRFSSASSIQCVSEALDEAARFLTSAAPCCVDRLRDGGQFAGTDSHAMRHQCGDRGGGDDPLQDSMADA